MPKIKRQINRKDGSPYATTNEKHSKRVVNRNGEKVNGKEIYNNNDNSSNGFNEKRKRHFVKREKPTEEESKTSENKTTENNNVDEYKEMTNNEFNDGEDGVTTLLKGTAEIIQQRITFVKGEREDTYNSLLSNLKPINSSSSNVFVMEQNGEANTSKSPQKASSSSDNDIDHNKDLEAPSTFLTKREVVIQLNQWNGVKKVGPGLCNLGNTCFMNAALQCLMYTPALRNYLLKRELMESSLKRFNPLDAMTLLAREMFSDTSNSNKKNNRKGVVSPDLIARHLKGIGSFILGRQEDSHEFIINLIDKMENALTQKYKGKLDTRVLETNAVHQVFGGYLRSQIKTKETNYISNTYDPFIDIELQLSNCSSIEKALQNYITPDLLDGKNKYKCPKTNKYVAASKRLTIYEAPINLILQLKRFNIFGKKVSKKIEYSETLNLSPFMSDKKTTARYNLYGVLVHSGGSSNSGHYYSYVKNSNGIWYRMDDTSVTQVSQSTALSQQAYILFYSRNSDDFKTENCTTLFKNSILSYNHIPPSITSSSTSSVPSTSSSTATISTVKEEQPKIITNTQHVIQKPNSEFKPPSPSNHDSAKDKDEAIPQVNKKDVSIGGNKKNKPTNIVIPRSEEKIKAVETPSPFFAPSRTSVLDRLTPQKLMKLKSMRGCRQLSLLNPKGIGGCCSPISFSYSSDTQLMWSQKDKLDEIKKNTLIRTNTPSTPIKPLIPSEAKPLNPFTLDNFTSDSPLKSPTKQLDFSSPKKNGIKRKSMSEPQGEDEPTVSNNSKKPSSSSGLIVTNAQYGEDVDVWDESKEAVKLQQEAVDQIRPVVHQKDEWDVAYDQGRQKKVRKKQTSEDWVETNNKFQKFAEKKHKKK
ncbi:hypothetical protein ABK040_015311 [Willaertia magna]